MVYLYIPSLVHENRQKKAAKGSERIQTNRLQGTHDSTSERDKKKSAISNHSKKHY